MIDGPYDWDTREWDDDVHPVYRVVLQLFLGVLIGVAVTAVGGAATLVLVLAAEYPTEAGALVVLIALCWAAGYMVTDGWAAISRLRGGDNNG